jgi:hypothetical protein
MIFDQPIPLTDALKSALLKRVLALSPDIGTTEIQTNIPQAIRERAFFSARTPYAQYLADTQSAIQRLIQPDTIVLPDGSTRPAGKGESISPSQIRGQMKQQLAALGYAPTEAEAGGLKDLSSDRRTNLIISTQLGMARGYGAWRQAQDPTVLDLWPADELYRALDRRIPRDWETRWNDARATLGDDTSATEGQGDDGPFVALKNDPIWAAISAFGNPYPPFDFESGMRVRDVDRDSAIDLGVLAPDDTPEPARDSFADPTLSELPADIPDALAQVLRLLFSDFLKLKEAP